MMTQNKKTRTDLLFEDYLKQRGIINFKYEPYKDGERNPDYSFSVKNKTILVEVKELLVTPDDRLSEQLKKVPPGTLVSSVGDLRDFLNQIRAKIDEASNQLKPRIKDADNCIIIIGKTQLGWEDEIDHFKLFHAMYGDLAYRRVYNKLGEPKLEPFGVGNGALRKYNSKTKTWIIQHSYVSAVGVVKRFSPYREQERIFADKFFNKHDVLDPKNLDKYQKAWEQHKKNIPKYARDPEKILYGLILIANRNSTKPLLKEVFNYRYDKYTYFE